MQSDDPSGQGVRRQAAAVWISRFRPAVSLPTCFVDPRFQIELGQPLPGWSRRDKSIRIRPSCKGVPAMKRLVTCCAVFGAGLMWTSVALAAQPQVIAPPADTPARGTMAAYFEDADKKTDEAPAAPAPAAEEKKE